MSRNFSTCNAFRPTIDALEGRSLMSASPMNIHMWSEPTDPEIVSTSVEVRTNPWSDPGEPEIVGQDMEVRTNPWSDPEEPEIVAGPPAMTSRIQMISDRLLNAM